MTSFGFVVHPDRPGAAEAATRLRSWLDGLGMETRAYASTPDGIDEEADAFTEGLDVVVSVGGDGTFLRAAHVASRIGCPVLGVKVGRVGFLTEVEPDKAPGVLQRLIDGTGRIEERLALLAESEPDSFPPQWSLNEMIVEKSARHRLVRLGLYVGEAYVTTLSADGVIVATPTGSTAYSFSAGGPIVSPGMRSILVTPVAAHMVFDRSLVLGADERVRLEILGDEPGLLSADGRGSIELPVGSSVRIGSAPQPARLVRREDAPPFMALVREKFELPDDHPQVADPSS
jgi:NAD+ kinase